MKNLRICKSHKLVKKIQEELKKLTPIHTFVIIADFVSSLINSKPFQIYKHTEEQAYALMKTKALKSTFSS